MKKLLLLLFAFAFLATACSRDDDPKEMLQGSWKPVKYVDKQSVSGSTPTIATVIPTSCEQESRLNFNTNGNGTFTEYSIATGGTCQVVDSGNFTYSYDDSTKTLTITDPNENKVMNVKTLSANELVMEWSYNFNYGGQTFSYSKESYYTKAN